jgi:hypothetical protein
MQAFPSLRSIRAQDARSARRDDGGKQARKGIPGDDFPSLQWFMQQTPRNPLTKFDEETVNLEAIGMLLPV